MPGAPLAIGPYRITGLLGEGGMGVVYAAEQEHPIRRRVAIKVIRGGLESSVAARFAVERQALAVMEHPSIARVLDAGATERGDPYFVMEYVEGVPIGAYCDEHRLSTRERLALFLHVCEAIQHAHQKGIIHRDLKPSNVLVTEQGGAPLPKVIDFGIAKAVGMRLTDQTLATEFGMVMGTPAYMSPEQAEGAGVDVDTRTDVYALGVMLYELLTGTLPVDPSKIGIVPFIAQLMARHTVTEAPSRRIETVRETAPALASLRRTEPAALARELRGDLDAITLKAMCPEREGRYQTAHALSLDIERYLHHEPVTARAPSLGYRLGKLSRRHPTAVALAASAIVFLVGVSVVTTVQARRVERARQVADQRRAQAEDLIGFMVGDLRGRLEPIGRLEILDAVGAKALEYFAAVPAGELTDEELFRRAQALGQLGQVRLAQGSLDLAVPAFRESLALARGLAVRDTSNAEWQVGLGASHFWLGYAHYLRGAMDSALAEFVPYLDISRRLVARDSTNAEWQLELGYAHSNIGSVKEAQGDLAGALDAFRYTLGVKQRLVAMDTANAEWRLDLGHTHNTVGRALERMGELDSARAHYSADLALKRALAARDTSNATWVEAYGAALSYDGQINELRGDLEAARASYAASHEIDRALLARDPANGNWARDAGAGACKIGRVDVAAGRAREGLARLRECRAALSTLFAGDTSNADVRLQLALAETELARAHAAAGSGSAALASAQSVERLLAGPAAAPGAERRLGIELARARLVVAELRERGGDRLAATLARTRALDALGGDAATDELLGVETRARALIGLSRAAEAEPLLARLRRAGYRPSGDAAFARLLAAAPAGR